MKFRFASWNVNHRLLTAGHLGRLRACDAHLLARQEVSMRGHGALAAANLFGWSVCSLALRPPRTGEGRARRLGCSLSGRGPSRLTSASLVRGLRFPERALVAEIQVEGHRLTACSFHTPPGASWGRVKPKTLKAIARWLAAQPGALVVGIDANAPRTDHPGISRCEWWWDEEPLLLGPAPLHGLEDALRVYLDASPDARAQALRGRPDGPLAVSHVRGSGRTRTECRYDFVYVSPEMRVHRVQYLFDEGIRMLSDHALVIADLELRPTGECGPSRRGAETAGASPVAARLRRSRSVDGGQGIHARSRRVGTEGGRS